MNAQTNPAALSTVPAAGKGKKAAKGATKPKRYIVLGEAGVAAVDALCTSVEKTIGFKPTQAQIVLRLIAQATEAAAAGQKPADAATATQGS
jgi:hypothetical protein